MPGNVTSSKMAPTTTAKLAILMRLALSIPLKTHKWPPIRKPNSSNTVLESTSTNLNKLKTADMKYSCFDGRDTGKRIRKMVMEFCGWKMIPFTRGSLRKATITEMVSLCGKTETYTREAGKGAEWMDLAFSNEMMGALWRVLSRTTTTSMGISWETLQCLINNTNKWRKGEKKYGSSTKKIKKQNSDIWRESLAKIQMIFYVW